MDYVENKEHNDICPVHQAVLKNSLTALKALVEENKNNLSCTNSLGQTPLLTGIIKKRSDNVVLYLIEAGSDVNALDCWSRNSLHTAIEHRLSHKIVHRLLEKGVDVNAQDVNGRTPIHHAVLHGLELLAMLLYYDADVTIESDEGFTALTNALGWCNFEAVEVLVDYYCHEDLGNIINNYFTVENNWLGLQFILKLGSSQLFKAIWPVIDTVHLLHTLPNFVIIYLNQCNFPKREWVESLLIILESDVASELITFMNKRLKGCNFQSLFCSLYDKKIDANDRVVLINVFLSLGAEVYQNDIRDVLNIYGCDKEFECLMYGVNCKHFKVINHPLCYYLVNLGSDYDSSRLLNLFKEQINSLLCVGSRVLQESIITNLGYFSFPSYVRYALLEECTKAHLSRRKIEEKLLTVPEFPTLLELSRNQFRNYLVQVYKVKYPYSVLDVIKRLEIPKIIKDIVLFRNAIY